jgi:predicted DCC family thiol-disulfide oxidoreductase YuxK
MSDSAANSPRSPRDPAPAGPVLVYDGQCEFCRRSVGRLNRMCGGRVAATPAGVDPADPAPPREVRLVLPDGRSFGGAEAIVRALAMRPAWRLVTWVYFLPGIRQVAGAVYRAVARNRHRL